MIVEGTVLYVNYMYEIAYSIVNYISSLYISEKSTRVSVLQGCLYSDSFAFLQNY